MELDIPPSPPPVELTLAARRAKRQAILAKYAGVASTSASPSPAQSSAVQPPQSTSPESNPKSDTPSAMDTLLDLGPSELDGLTSKQLSMSASPTPSPEDFEVAKDGEQETVQVKVQAENASADQVSAADYDPSLDRRQEEQRRARVSKDEPTVDVEEIIEEEEDVDDMFAVSTDAPKTKKVRKIIKPAAPALITTILRGIIK
jgi:serine/threonine-protein kinase PRP4